MNHGTPTRRALLVADSDSYLKWAVQRFGDLPRSWRSEIVVVDNAVTPSPAQMAAAVDERLPSHPDVVGLPALVHRLRNDPPDLLLLACRGPLIEVLLLEELRGVPAATVVAAGIPGIWYPPTALGITFRSAVDQMIVHSHRERRAVADYLPCGRISDVGLASLPRVVGPLGSSPRPRVVFAPQALVPTEYADRRRLLDALVILAETNPGLDVVVKLRGRHGEAQTHAEHASFPDLAQERAALPANLIFVEGPLRAYLGDCVGFVTVSSTAALEAIDAGVPTLILSDFGVNEAMINLVFEGSGLLGTLDDLVALRFRRPDPAWLRDNYFHETNDDDWVARVEAGIAEGYYRDRGQPVHDTVGIATLPHRIRRRWVALGARDTPGRRMVNGTLNYAATLAESAGLRLKPSDSG